MSTGLDIVASGLLRPADVSVWEWGEITDDAPLRVQLDVDSAPLALTPSTLVGGLNIGDRVWVQLVTNADPTRRHRRAIIHGRALGLPSDSVSNAQLAQVPTQTFKGRKTASTGAPEDLTLTEARELLALPNVVCTRFVAGGALSTTSTSYADLSTFSVSFTKRHASTKLLVRVDGTWFFADGSAGTGGGGTLGVNVNSTDYPLVVQNKTVASLSRLAFSGADSISGLAANTYTVQARWKAQTSGKAVQMNTSDDTLTITVMEVWS